MNSQPRKSRNATPVIIGGVVLFHLLIAAILFQWRTMDVIPKRNLPYVAPIDPPNFGSRTYTQTDPATGERYSVTEYVVSTKFYTPAPNPGETALTPPPATAE